MRWLFLMPVIALLGTAGAAHADGMRCNERLVQTGDSQYQVRSVCGPPDMVAQRTEYRAVRRNVYVCKSGSCSNVTIDDAVPIQVEEWTYDFGKQRFLQIVTFVEGKIEQVRNGAYGTKDR